MESGKWHCVSILEVTSVDVLVKGYISPRCVCMCVCGWGGGAPLHLILSIYKGEQLFHIRRGTPSKLTSTLKGAINLFL